MARIARVVIPGIPHHVTQRGNRRQPVFFCDDDYRLYKRLVAEFCQLQKVQVLAYCLMPNHTHLIMVPSHPHALRFALGEAHRRYTLRINFSKGWRGYLWQGRFASYPMDETHLYRAVRYVELNPVRAGLCEYADQWPWSSALAHLSGNDDDLVEVGPMLERIPDWQAYMKVDEHDDEEPFSRHERTGRPLGSKAFVRELETISGRTLQPRKAGRKPAPE